MDIPASTEAYHAVGYEVLLDKKDFVHHFLLFGCSDPVAKVRRAGEEGRWVGGQEAAGGRRRRRSFESGIFLPQLEGCGGSSARRHPLLRRNCLLIYQLNLNLSLFYALLLPPRSSSIVIFPPSFACC